MRVFSVAILLGVLVFSLNSFSLTKEYPLTPSQKHFTAIIKQLPGVVSLEWESPISLWVKASAKAVGSPAKPEKAKQLADILAERGRTALRQPFCVHIYQQRTKELAGSCVYY